MVIFWILFHIFLKPFKTIGCRSCFFRICPSRPNYILPVRIRQPFFSVSARITEMKCQKICHFLLFLLDSIIGDKIINIISLLIHIPNPVSSFFPRNDTVKVSSCRVASSDTDTIVVVPDTDFLTIYGKSFSSSTIFLFQEALHFFIIQTFNQSCCNMKQCIFLSASRAENIIYHFIGNKKSGWLFQCSCRFPYFS